MSLENVVAAEKNTLRGKKETHRLEATFGFHLLQFHIR
jgi:hypothetical protein